MKEKIFHFSSAIYRTTDLLKAEEPIRLQLRAQAAEALRLAANFERGIYKDSAETYLNILSCLTSIRSLLALAGASSLVRPVNAQVLDREGRLIEEHFEYKLKSFYEHALVDKERSFRDENTKTISVSPPSFQSPPQINDHGKAINNEIISDNYKGHYKDSMSFIDNLSEESQMTNGRKSDVGSKEALKESVRDSNIEKNQELSERQKAILGFLMNNGNSKMSDLGQLFSNELSMKTLQRDIMSLMGQGMVTRQGDKRWSTYQLNPAMKNIASLLLGISH